MSKTQAYSEVSEEVTKETEQPISISREIAFTKVNLCKYAILRNVLNGLGFVYIGDLIQKSPKELLSSRNFGSVALKKL